MKVCVTADDYGLEPAHDRVIEELAAAGRLDAVAVCTHRGAHLEHVGRLVDAGVAVGPHLTLVAEAPHTGGLGRAGALPPSWRSFVAWFLAGRIRPSALRREIDAQLDAYTRTGLPFDFLNGHQHLHLFPPVARIVAEALSRRAPDARVRRVRWSDAASAKERALAVCGRLADVYAGPPLHALALGASGAMDAETVGAALRVASPSPLCELVFHPGAAARHASVAHAAWGYRWSDEAALLASGAVDEALHAAGAARPTRR